MINADWPFDQGANVATITTWQVLRDAAPVTVVIHYSDDHSWAFLGGNGFTLDDAAVVSMSEILSRDPTLFEIADLEPGSVARRDQVGGDWTREVDPEM
jgi:hypothetical protein